jgi:Bacterial regulatory proteins, luxR family
MERVFEQVGPETITNAPQLRRSCTIAAETKGEPQRDLGCPSRGCTPGRSRGATQLTHGLKHRREPHGTKLESRVWYESPFPSARESQFPRRRYRPANKQIADRLSVTEDTVKGRVKSILAKLEANDRRHAAIIGLKRGIIEL